MCADCCCCEKESPNKNLSRKNVCCTDIVFLLIFMTFWGGMIYMAVFAITQGDAYRLVFGYDSFGNTCNEDNAAKKVVNITQSGMDVTGKMYVSFMNVLDPENSMEICVSKCPDRELLTPFDVKDFYEETGSKLCNYDIEPSQYTDWSLYDRNGNGPCPKLPVFASSSVVFRCVPDPTKLNDSLVLNSVVSFLNSQDNVFRKILSDFYSTWKDFIYMCLVALGISFLTVLLIRFLAFVIVWVTVILASVSSIVGTAFLWWTYVQIKNDNQRAKEKFDVILLDIDINNETAFLAFSITATVLTVLLLLVILIMRKRIQLVVALFGEAGKCVIAMPLLLIQPVFTFIVLLVFLAYWFIIIAFITTCATPSASYEKPFIEIEYTQTQESRIFFWYYVVGLIWTSEFILAAQQFVIGSAVAMWYFSRDKPNCCNCLVAKAIARLLCHHIGTIAFGSFIITLVKIPRYILMYIHNKYKDSQSEIAKCCLKCCICCLWCLEKILKYLHQNAYTITAIEGRSFCPAAKRAIGIIASNALRVAALNSVGDFVLFLGKVGVMASTCAIGVLWYRSIPGLHYFALPVVFLCFVSYIMAHCFLSVYEMIVDALLLCFCVDSEINDGSPGNEYYMSTALMGFVEKSSYDMDVIDGRIKPGTERPTESQPLSSAPRSRTNRPTEIGDVKPQVV